MGSYRYSGERRGPLEDVYVARTVQQRDKRVASFVNSVGRHLGSAAAIKVVGSMHLTILESYGVKSRFRNLGYTPEDVRTFRGDLDGHLRHSVSAQDTVVLVDRDRPVRWIGSNLLALNIQPSQHLLDTRAASEEFLEDRFGSVPRLRAFEPHITIGKVYGEISDEEREDPRVLLPARQPAPGYVALNGLEVYLGRIHPNK